MSNSSTPLEDTTNHADATETDAGTAAAGDDGNNNNNNNNDNNDDGSEGRFYTESGEFDYHAAIEAYAREPIVWPLPGYDSDSDGDVRFYPSSLNNDHFQADMYHFIDIISRLQERRAEGDSLGSHYDDDEDDYDDDEEHDDVIPEAEYDPDYEDYSNMQDDDDDDDDDDDEDDPDPCTCPDCLMDRIVGSGDCCYWKDGDETKNNCDEQERPLHPDASPCAICMEQETARRRFVHLPCCATSEGTSSTRFCKPCLARCILTNGCAVPCHSKVQLAGECPRCKNILVLEERNMITASNRNLLPLYQRTRVAMPSTEALFWYVARNGRKDGTEYRAYLLTLAVCPNPNFIPEELLFENSETSERLRTLCQWGLLSKRPTTREWLQKQNTVMGLQKLAHQFTKDLHLTPVLGPLWKAIASIVGPRLERAQTKICQSRKWRIICKVVENLKEEAKIEGTAVYCMDPAVQAELRRWVFLYLHCFESDEWYEFRNCDGRGKDHVIKLLPPFLRTPTEKELAAKEWFAEKNCRHLCAMVAYKTFGAAYRAHNRLRFARSYWLINLGMSLAVLSTKYLGLSPICDWPDPTQTCSADSKGTIPWIVACAKNTRWRWHLMTGLNILLVKVGWKLVFDLLFIAWDLIVGASFCLALGKLIGVFSTKPNHKSLRPESEQKREAWLEAGQSVGCLVVFLNVAWSVLPWLLEGKN